MEASLQQSSITVVSHAEFSLPTVPIPAIGCFGELFLPPVLVEETISELFSFCLKQKSESASDFLPSYVGRFLRVLFVRLVQRRLRLAVIPLIQQTDFFACFDA